MKMWNSMRSTFGEGVTVVSEVAVARTVVEPAVATSLCQDWGRNVWLHLKARASRMEIDLGHSAQGTDATMYESRRDWRLGIGEYGDQVWDT